MIKSIIIWIIMLLLSFTATTYFDGALSFLLFYFLLIVPVICLLYILVQYNRLTFWQKTDSERMIVDSPEHYSFELKNDSLLAHCYNIKLKLADNYYDIEGLDKKNSFDLKPSEKIEQDTYVIFRYRGKYEVGVSSINVPDFLNFLNLSFKNRQALKVLVMPKITILNHLKTIPEFDTELEDISSKEKNEIDVLVRDYMAGDSLNRINWKASAREQALKTREYTGTRRFKLSVIIDTVSIDAAHEKQLACETKIMETAIALIRYFTTGDTEISVFYNNYSDKQLIPINFEINNMFHFEHFYNEFGNVIFAPSVYSFKAPKFFQAESLSDSSIVILVVSNVTAAIAEYANELAKTDIKVNIYSVTGNPEKNYSEQLHSLISLTIITPFEDIKEVL